MQSDRRGRLVRISALAAMIGVTAAACGHAQAKTPGPTPALAVPDPPSRLVIPVALEIPAPTPAPSDKPVPTTSPRPSAARPTPTPVATPTPTPSPTPVETPPPVLQTTATPGEFEARAQDWLARARKDLARVSPGKLSRDARDQYDSAERFIRMAQDAIAAKNFVYAAYCADKAATLAGLLVK